MKAVLICAERAVGGLGSGARVQSTLSIFAAERRDFFGRLFQQDVRARNLIFCKTIAHGNRARPRTVAALGAPASLQIRLLVQQLTKRNFAIYSSLFTKLVATQTTTIARNFTTNT